MARTHAYCFPETHHLAEGKLAASEEPETNVSSDEATGGSGYRKGVPWTENEHRAFLKGLQSLGKGNWRGISRMFVSSRSPTQVASHAQKYFLRLNGCTKRRSRFSGLEVSSRTHQAHQASKPVKSTPPAASPTSSAEVAPPAQSVPAAGYMPMPYMMPPMVFAMPGGGTFMHPMFCSPALAAAFSKQGLMMPFMLPEPGAKDAAAASVKLEVTGDSAANASSPQHAHTPSESAPIKPAARRTSDGSQASDFLSCLCIPSSCQVALQASAHSAFRPTGRQVAV